MNFAWPTHSSWQKPQPQYGTDRIPPPTQKIFTFINSSASDIIPSIHKLRELDGGNLVTKFPQNPSFMAALNRSRTIMSSAPSMIPSTEPKSTSIRPSNLAVYNMQRNMFERVKVTGTGCGSCRGNK
jgi:hypothetical protein